MTDTDENFESPDYENISINIQSQPSCSRSISPFHTPPYDNTNINTSNITHNTSTIPDYNFHSTTADNDSSNKNNSAYDKIHINTEELEFDDDTDDAPFTQCTQTTYNSDIASTQDSHYNTNIPQRRQPLLLRVTPATSNETFSSVPFQSNNNTPLRHSNIHNQSSTFTQQTPRQQQFPRRRLQTPRQRQQIPRRQLQTPRQQQHTPKPQNTARNNKRKLDDKLHNYLENTENYLLKKINNDTDEDLCFFKGTLSIIKEFSPDKKFRFKQEYMNLLTTFKNETV